MTARAASAALAIVAGSLVTPLAAAAPPPPLDAPPPAESASPIAPVPPIETAPVVAPPSYAPPGYAPPGYAPPGYAPPGYAPPGYAPPGYAPPVYGNVVLFGTLAGAMDFGAGAVGPLIDPTVTSYYVARLPEAGAPIYAKVPMALAGPVRFAAAVGPDGTVVLGGTFVDKAWLGAEPPHQAMSETGFLVALAPDGSIAWSAVIDGAVVTQVALDQGDIVAVVGISYNAIVGGKKLLAGKSGTFLLARFDPAGALRYAIPLGDGSLDVTSFVMDSAGHSLLSGKLFTPLSLADSSANPAGRPSNFFAELDRSGVHVRSMAFGCASSSTILAVPHDGSRDVLLASTFSGAVDSGKGQIPSAGSTDVLVAKLPAK